MIKNFLIKNKYLILIFVFVIFNLFVSFYYLGYKHDLGNKDAYEYYRAANFLKGSTIDGAMQLDRVLTTPAFLYTSIVVNYFVGDFSVSFAIINIIFYFLLAFTFYYLVLEIYKEEKVAFLSTILFVFNFYVIEPGNFHLADFGGWFFFILATLFVVKYFNTANKRFYFFSIIASAIGVFLRSMVGWLWLV